MELLEAIKFVLKQNKKPMHFKELAKSILTQKLVEKGAQTLETIINTKLALEIKRCERKKIETTFLRLDNGLIGLKVYEDSKPVIKQEEPSIPAAIPAETLKTEAALNSIDEMIAQEMTRVKALYVEKLQTMSFLSFERLFENFLHEINFIKYTVVNRRTDGGIDYAVNVSFLENNVNMLAVIRRWPFTRKFTFKNVDEIINTMTEHKFNMAVIVLFSELEADVKQYMKEKSKFPMFCVNASELCEIFISRGIGITAKNYTGYEFNNEYVKKIEEEIAQKIENHKKNGKIVPAPAAGTITGEAQAQIPTQAKPQLASAPAAAAEQVKPVNQPAIEPKTNQPEHISKQQHHQHQHTNRPAVNKDDQKANRNYNENKNFSRDNAKTNRYEKKPHHQNRQNVNTPIHKDTRPNARQNANIQPAANENEHKNSAVSSQHVPNENIEKKQFHSETPKINETVSFNEPNNIKNNNINELNADNFRKNEPQNINDKITTIITEPVKINTVIPSHHAEINIIPDINTAPSESMANKNTGIQPLISNISSHTERRIGPDASKPVYKKKYNPKKFHKNYSKTRPTIHKGN